MHRNIEIKVSRILPVARLDSNLSRRLASGLNSQMGFKIQTDATSLRTSGAMASANVLYGFTSSFVKVEGKRQSGRAAKTWFQDLKDWTWN